MWSGTGRGRLGSWDDQAGGCEASSTWRGWATVFRAGWYRLSFRWDVVPIGGLECIVVA